MTWLAWGFLLPTTTLAHATFAINTINHLYGSRRFDTVDESRNNVITALFAAGEGWHNNHHRYQRAARNGFYWWEFDPTWYVIKAMSLVGLAWDLQSVPERIYREARERTGTSADAAALEAASTDDVRRHSPGLVSDAESSAADGVWPFSAAAMAVRDGVRPACASARRSRNSI